MLLVFQGHMAHQTESVEPAVLTTREYCGRAMHGDRGCFLHRGRWGQEQNPHGQQVLSVVFRPIIYLNSTLSDDDHEDALNHELQHFADFQRLAQVLHGSVAAAVSQGSDHHMAGRWSWFLYDLCVASRDFHRSINAHQVESCMHRRPAGNRP